LTLLACISFSWKSQKLVLLKCKKTKQNKTKHQKQKNSRAAGHALKSAVRTLIDKLASQIVRLKAIVRT